MSNKLNNEQKEFIRVFMLSEMGLTVKRKKVKNFLLRYTNEDYGHISELFDEFGDAFCYAMLDALCIWHAGIAQGSQSSVDLLSIDFFRGKF